MEAADRTALLDASLPVAPATIADVSARICPVPVMATS
jgi:hypothetical protein